MESDLDKHIEDKVNSLIGAHGISYIVSEDEIVSTIVNAILMYLHLKYKNIEVLLLKSTSILFFFELVI